MPEPAGGPLRRRHGPGTSSTAATTTTAAPAPAATTATTATTEAPATARESDFTADDVTNPAPQDFDPRPVPIEGVAPFPVSLEGILLVDWFPEERAAHTYAGFVAASPAVARQSQADLVTERCLPADDAGAPTALGTPQGPFSDFDLVTMIGRHALDSMNLLFPLGAPSPGDRGVGELVSGPQAQVVGIIWMTDNLLQFVRAGMGLGREGRAAAVLDVARAMAGRTG